MNAADVKALETTLVWTARLKRLFFWLPIAYVVFILALTVHRSSLRKSILSERLSGDESQGSSGANVVSAGDAKVLVQDFHRLEFKNGKPAWELKARDARYYPAELVTHVNEFLLVVFREKGRTVQVSADTGKLNLGVGSLKKAELSGNLVIKFDDGMILKGNSGEFDAESKVFTVREEAQILGNGFQIDGVGLNFDVDGGLARLEHNVRCKFETNAQVPRDLSLDVAKQKG